MSDDDHKNKHLSAAYEPFKDRLCQDYLISSNAKNFASLQQALNMIPGTSSQEELDQRCVLACLFPIYGLYWCTRTKFVVEENLFALVIDLEGPVKKTVIYGPGYHILGYYKKLQGVYSFESFGKQGLIQSEIGDLKLALVDQGTIMHLDFGGQNIILGPGLHKINQPLEFKNLINLDAFYIEIGPEKWVTVPDGYDGVSIDRGNLKVLQGGKQHHLAHVSDKFLKMVPKTLLTDRVATDIPTYCKNIANRQIQTRQEDDLSEYLLCTTTNGAGVFLDAMIFWRIVDTSLAAKTAMEILYVEGAQNDTRNNKNQSENQVIQAAQNNISTLRQTVLRIVKHHLTALVGRCSLSGEKSHEGPESKYKQQQINNNINVDQMENPIETKMKSRDKNKDSLQTGSFDILYQLQNSIAAIKDFTNIELATIGVTLENMCIYSVKTSKEIQNQLDAQIKARVDGNTAVIQANAKKNTAIIEQQIATDVAIAKAKANAEVTIMNANAKSESLIIEAKGQSQAIVNVAEARKDEADKLKEPLAQELAKLRVTGEVGEKIFQGTSNTFTFGQNPGDIIYGMLQDIGKRK